MDTGGWVDLALWWARTLVNLMFRGVLLIGLVCFVVFFLSLSLVSVLFTAGAWNNGEHEDLTAGRLSV